MITVITTSDINVAAFLLYHNIEPASINLQRKGDSEEKKAVIVYDNPAAAETMEGFYADPTPLVELRRYNSARAEIVKKINKIKYGN